MALVEVELKTHFTIPTTSGWGDIHVRNHATTHFAYDEFAPILKIGIDVKAVAPSWTIFLRYSLEDIPGGLPSGATFTRGYFKVTSAGTPDADAVFGFNRVGHLEHDGAWNNTGNNAGWATPYYPAGDSTNFPFPTLPLSDALIPGVLVDDAWMGYWPYANTWTDGQIRTFGDAAYSPQYPLNFIRADAVAHAINDDRANYGSDVKYVAFVMDGWQLPVSILENVKIRSRDYDGATHEGVVLFLEYDENPPTITNTPPTAGAVAAPYSEQMTATDPTGQTVTFAFLQNPAGATMVSGLIAWTPTIGQVGNNTFEVEATDEDGFTDTLLWVVTIPSVPAVLAGTLGAVPVLDATGFAAEVVLDATELDATPVIDATRLDAEVVLDATELTATPVLDMTRLEAEPVE